MNNPITKTHGWRRSMYKKKACTRKQQCRYQCWEGGGVHKKSRNPSRMLMFQGNFWGRVQGTVKITVKIQHDRKQTCQSYLLSTWKAIFQLSLSDCPTQTILKCQHIWYPQMKASTLAVTSDHHNSYTGTISNERQSRLLARKQGNSFLASTWICFLSKASGLPLKFFYFT